MKKPPHHSRPISTPSRRPAHTSLTARTGQWERFVAITSAATVCTGDNKNTKVSAGNVFVQPPGTATRFGKADFVFYVIKDDVPVDSI